MLHKGKASTLLTGSRGLDRAQVITVDTKINTFRFSKWLISSFRAVGPKSQAVTWIHLERVLKSCVLLITSGTWSDSSFKEWLYPRGASPLMLPPPHLCPWLPHSSYPTSSEPSSNLQPLPISWPAAVCSHFWGGLVIIADTDGNSSWALSNSHHQGIDTLISVSTF